VVIGVDSSPQMAAAAQERGVDARIVSGESLRFDCEFDGVFSNAALHWMSNAGQEADGSHLYMCAAYTDGVVPQLGEPGMENMVGKTRPGLGGCSFGYSGQEMIYPN
jgi:hypothetical protein